MELVNIQTCDVAITLDVDECLLIAEGLRRAGDDVSTDEGVRCYFWHATALALQAATLPARMLPDMAAHARGERYMRHLREAVAELMPPDVRRAREQSPPAA